jgi:hypothetical protein
MIKSIIVDMEQYGSKGVFVDYFGQKRFLSRKFVIPTFKVDNSDILFFTSVDDATTIHCLYLRKGNQEIKVMSSEEKMMVRYNTLPDAVIYVDVLIHDGSKNESFVFSLHGKPTLVRGFINRLTGFTIYL